MTKIDPPVATNEPMAALAGQRAPATRPIASHAEAGPLSARLLGVGQLDNPAAPLTWPAPPSFSQGGAGIVSSASASIPASHTPVIDAVFAATGQAAADTDAWVFGAFSGRDADAI